MTIEHRQWAVTDFGIEECKDGGVLDGGYYIAADQLTEISTGERGPGTEGLYDWPLHMTGKMWVDVEDFLAVFYQAVQFHNGKYKPDFDRRVFQATAIQCRSERAADLRFSAKNKQGGSNDDG